MFIMCGNDSYEPQIQSRRSKDEKMTEQLRKLEVEVDVRQRAANEMKEREQKAEEIASKDLTQG